MTKVNRISTKARRLIRVRRKILGTSNRPRLSVHRTNHYIYAQIIDDNKGQTLAAASDQKMKGTKMERAAGVGEVIAKAAIKANVSEIVFDRGNKAYHGRIKTLAQAARAAGLIF